MLSSKDFTPGQKVWVVHGHPIDRSYSIEETEVVEVVHSIIYVQCHKSFHRVGKMFYEYDPTVAKNSPYLKYLKTTGFSVLFPTRESAVEYVNMMGRLTEKNDGILFFNDTIIAI